MKRTQITVYPFYYRIYSKRESSTLAINHFHAVFCKKNNINSTLDCTQSTDRVRIITLLSKLFSLRCLFWIRSWLILSEKNVCTFTYQRVWWIWPREYVLSGLTNTRAFERSDHQKEGCTIDIPQKILIFSVDLRVWLLWYIHSNFARKLYESRNNDDVATKYGRRVYQIISLVFLLTFTSAAEMNMNIFLKNSRGWCLLHILSKFHTI